MANIANPLPYLSKRELGLITNLKPQLFSKRLNAAKNLYRRDLVCHFGCVNAIEFSNNGELLVSGGDDRRIMLWKFGQAIFDQGKPEAMRGMHQSNVFCIGITSDNKKIFSGGNDDIVIVHDAESKMPLEVLQHQRAVCGLSVDPFNEQVVATAGNDARLLLFDTRQSVHESLVISRSRKAFHGVQFHPHQVGVLVSGNARDGVALWDLRSPKHPVVRYNGNTGPSQNCMSVCFNSSGTSILALRRRLSPVLYAIHSPEPVAEFYHQDYYNSCTMKSCTFAGEKDEFVLSGSDDFNLYMWKVPEGETSSECDTSVEAPHLVLSGHRSIVNQVRYNPHFSAIASSGVEKIIKVWSCVELPGSGGSLSPAAAERPRDLYTHEDYVSLVHHSQQYISHNYTEQSTSEDPRMMAFFDSLVQRELECVLEESDSSSAATHHSAPPHSDSDTRPAHDYIARITSGGSTRRAARLARLAASRCHKRQAAKRGLMRYSRRNKHTRTTSTSSPSCAGASSRRAGGAVGGAPRRSAPARPARPPRPPRAPRTRREALSDRDSDDAPAVPRMGLATQMIRPLRRRMQLTRAAKRKSKNTYYRKMTTRSNGSSMSRDLGENNFNSFDNQDQDNLAVPSTSTGYRGQNSSLFRIAEVDSDDDQSLSSRPISPQNSNQVPNNLVSIVPTPLNGSRDSLGESLRIDNTDHITSHERLRTLRRRRNGRSMRRSDSSESPSRMETADSDITERLSPQIGHNKSVARLMNETNESEMESSCSTEGSAWPTTEVNTPDSGVGTAAGSSTRNNNPAAEVSDDPEYQAAKFRQRVKKARRNYRKHLDSDSN